MKKRFISFVLAIMVLIPLIPNFSYGKALVKNIDVYDNNFRLLVEGKNTPHKEVFLYEGDLYVPMTDLGRGLGMGVSFDANRRILSLNSNGHLSFDDSSLYPIAYQRGYEIGAKERIIDGINNQIRNFLDGTNSKSSSLAGDLRSISVGFSAIDVLLDGKKIPLGGQGLVYRDDLYLPLTSLSPYLYITPKLNGNNIDIDANGVLLDKPLGLVSGNYTIEALVAFREDLNNRFARELEELEKKKQIVMDVKIPYEKIGNLSEMEKYLNKHLGEIKDLDIDISLKSATGNWYYADISFNSRYLYRWRDLSRRDVEAHIWDVYVAISNLYDGEAKIQGKIGKYVSFDTKGKNIVFSFIDSGLDMTSKVDPVFLQELLEKYYDRYRGIYFDYDVRISGYDLELEIRPSASSFMDRWSPSEKLDFLERINNEIKRYYPGVKVNGKILYDGYEPIGFVIEDSKVRSPQLMTDSSDFLEDRFGILSSSGIRIPIEYSLSEIDKDNFKLMAYLDFDTTDSRWNTAMKDDLTALIHEVVKYVVSMWDSNVFVEVFDKNQVSIFEYVISQDTVQMVVASPGGGQIAEGTSISLSSGTGGATIYFTTDANIPNTSSPVYSGPILISKDTTIRAYAVKEGFKDSPHSSFEYKVIDNKNMASGLDNLSISPGNLSPRFTKNESNYVLDLAFGTTRVDVKPSASLGNISINGDIVASDSIKRIDVRDGDTIEIVHKEEGKPIDRIYSVRVRIGDETPSDVNLDPNYKFITIGRGIFSGRLTGNSFGYYIQMYTTSEKAIGDKVRVATDGSFEITGFPIDFSSLLVGYSYRIFDSNNNMLNISYEKLSEK